MTWQRRIERAEELAAESPVLPELLHFYREIARFPIHGCRRAHARQSRGPARPHPPHRARPHGASRAWRPHLGRTAAQRRPDARFLRARPPAGQTPNRARVKARSPAGVQPLCPFCGEKPVAAVLRPEGDGGKRFLLCSLCFTEWEFRRLLCPHCGEEDKEKLPVYTAAEMPHVRVEACDTCRVYLKAIDLTKNGLAVPEVDELAAVALDLWAAEHGYTKLQTNLFGM